MSMTVNTPMGDMPKEIKVERPKGATNKIRIGQRLNPGDQIWSNSGQYMLIYQGDGNLCVYNMWGPGGFASQNCVWDTLHTCGIPLHHPGHIEMNAQGNIVMWSVEGALMWQTHTHLPHK